MGQTASCRNYRRTPVRRCISRVNDLQFPAPLFRSPPAARRSPLPSLRGSSPHHESHQHRAERRPPRRASQPSICSSSHARARVPRHSPAAPHRPSCPATRTHTPAPPQTARRRFKLGAKPPRFLSAGVSGLPGGSRPPLASPAPARAAPPAFPAAGASPAARLRFRSCS